MSGASSFGREMWSLEPELSFCEISEKNTNYNLCRYSSFKRKKREFFDVEVNTTWIKKPQDIFLMWTRTWGRDVL